MLFNTTYSLMGVLVFEILTNRRGDEKIAQKYGVSLKGQGGALLETGGFQIFSAVFLQKSMFSLLLEFFCLVNIHACCNQ